jgi:hypothetical protein
MNLRRLRPVADGPRAPGSSAETFDGGSAYGRGRRRPAVLQDDREAQRLLMSWCSRRNVLPFTAEA